MSKFYSFESIGQFRNALKYLAIVSDQTTFLMTGHVKIHGTNAGITLTKEGELITQSRNNILSTGKCIGTDNAGFARWVVDNYDVILKSLERIQAQAGGGRVTVFGEWCGGSIQKGIALSGIDPKKFIVFKIEAERGYLTRKQTLYSVSHSTANYFSTTEYPQGVPNTFHIEAFGYWEEFLDLDNPELVQNKLIEYTLAVEKECPVGKFFGVSGTGEGIVWTIHVEGRTVMFKVKGEEHSASKVKTLAAVDTEQVESIKQFLDSFVNDHRLQQGIDQLVLDGKDGTDPKNIGDFIRWIVADLKKEESDTIEKSGIPEKVLNSAIATKARKWYTQR